VTKESPKKKSVRWAEDLEENDMEKHEPRKLKLDNN